eukprot:TRINITY_DN1043_c0_g1_i8.p1 TRINITY_DN1043_c0_g1~~TRINITY_DN1043_c0_g1_i8.p1  ORF type:complete len:722 (-),score=141.28 TRINITY_DN1043_c0_g1_i8:537-2702(-)
MDGSDRMGDRNFRVNFSGDGAARLRERVKDKLKEFMGDYTDDTLVEYVIVLLRNGRHKEEARKELNVFLGDDSGSFVSWLWDHLSSNLHLYVQPQSSADEVAKTKPMLDKQTERNESQLEHAHGNFDLASEHEGEKPVKESRSRRNREWKGLVRDVDDPPPLRSTEIDNFHPEKKNLQRPGLVKRSRLPRPRVENKRGRQDEQLPTKRGVTSHPRVGAPRRLLQFAVRDAVGTLRSSSSRSEPALKRLRSVVSTSAGDSSFDEQSQETTKSVVRASHAMSTAIKAAADAAEDVIKVRCAGNVFDRLGHGIDISEGTNQSSQFKASTPEDGEYEDIDQILPAELPAEHTDFFQRSDYNGESEANMTLLEQDTGLASDSASASASDYDEYDDIGVIGRRFLDASQSASSGNKDGNSLKVQYSVAQNTDDGIRKTRMKEQVPPATAVPNTSRKIVNISVNVNTWKPSHYQVPREVTEVENRMPVQENDVGAGKPVIQVMKEVNTATTGTGNETPGADAQKESQKIVTSTPGLYSTVRTPEDTDSRTVFVSNVHFAATKDTLSRHFNKFGEVLKVVIMTDAATGQLKGSAYVEFTRKEAAELALSLNGTSFMSRILKVVLRGSAHHETAPMMVWPRMPRASPFTSRLPRLLRFPRGIPHSFRPHLPVKHGARSLQWKRESPSGEATGSLQNSSLITGNNAPTPTGRGLTYVRTESKLDGNTGPTA